jgi:hypothetical protein
MRAFLLIVKVLGVSGSGRAGRGQHPCWPEDGRVGMGVSVNVDIMAILIFR